ncbi:hypothetical protein [Ruegeria sp. HKCCC1038]|uniref:hypothetical protein n=1 Tax=Ruegeria sp. HKCCC1038 TaxID=2682982 RepID=UPI001489BF2A|nr:hypothetical protein [Ruegeria sp. HKCCC1038]
MASLSQEVRELFEPRSELHKLRVLAAKFLNADEWKSLKRTSERFEKERRAAQRSYETEYEGRVAKVIKRLINEAGSVRRHLTPRGLGIDGFNRDQIRRQAKLEVRAAHKSELAQIDKREAEATRLCLDDAMRRGQPREKLIGDFQTATDRRLGQERCTRSWSR